MEPDADSLWKADAGYVFFTVKNTGEPSATDPSLHYQNTSRWLQSDIYRLSVTTENKGWSVQLLNALASLEPGETVEVPIYVERGEKVSRRVKVNLRVQSESDPAKIMSSSTVVKKGTRFSN